LSVSSDHYKQGKQAIRWDWKQSDVLTINNPAGMAQACATYKGGMMLWVYNPVPLTVPLCFDFLDAAGTIQYTFQYQLNFKGWRACWIRFKEDMDGLKQNTALQKLKIKAPSRMSAGTIWLDRMKFPATRIHDNVTPDAQLPDINPAMNTNLWCSLWFKYTNYQYQLSTPQTITSQEQQDILALRANVLADASGSAPTASELTSAINTFKSWNIVRNNGAVTGAPFVAADEKETGDISFKDVDKLIYTFAREWHHKKQPASTLTCSICSITCSIKGLRWGAAWAPTIIMDTISGTSPKHSISYVVCCAIMAAYSRLPLFCSTGAMWPSRVKLPPTRITSACWIIGTPLPPGV
jgi:Lyase, N terminal.